MVYEREKRYERNGTSVTPEDNVILANKRVCIVGCGGLGGYIAEMLVRVGVTQLTLIDYDVFDETNLNRQLFSTESGIGKSKVEEARKRLLAVDSRVQLTLHQAKLTAENAQELIAGHDIVVDALDNIEGRWIAANVCQSLGIPFVHGAIGGWYGQVSVVMPDGKGLEQLYGTSGDADVDKTLGNLPFVAGFVACMQVAEVVKLLLGKQPNLQGSFARVDLSTYELDVF